MRRTWLALLLLATVMASAFTSSLGATRREARPGPIPRIHLHHEALDHLQPRPDDFRVQPARRDPSGKKGSGGRAVAHHAGARPIEDGAVTAKAPEARLHRTGFGSWEPTMGATASGDIFFNALSEGGDPIIVASKDRGRSWDVVFDGHPFTADPYMYVDPGTSRVFANDLIPPCHLISHSDDGGETWTTAPPAACGYNEDHQTIFAGPPPDGGDAPEGYDNVVYICSIGYGISVASAGSVCSKSLDGGVTFLPTGTPAFYDDPTLTGDFGVPGLCNGANAHGFVGPDGTVYLPRGWCGQPYLAMSRDEGLTWDRVQVADNGMPCCADLDGIPGELYSHEAGVVADARGNVYYTWVAADRLPYLSVSRDGGKTWGKPMMIGPPGLREALLPGITIGKAGRIAVFYMGSTNSPWNGTEATGPFDDERWNAYITMTVDALSRNPVFYSAPLNDPRDPMWIGPCGPDPIRCGWGDFLDIVVGPGGEPWAVAVDLCEGTDCSGGGEAVVGRLVGGPRL